MCFFRPVFFFVANRTCEKRNTAFGSKLREFSESSRLSLSTRVGRRQKDLSTFGWGLPAKRCSTAALFHPRRRISALEKSILFSQRILSISDANMVIARDARTSIYLSKYVVTLTFVRILYLSVCLAESNSYTHTHRPNPELNIRRRST